MHVINMQASIHRSEDQTGIHSTGASWTITLTSGCSADSEMIFWTHGVGLLSTTPWEPLEFKGRRGSKHTVKNEWNFGLPLIPRCVEKRIDIAIVIFPRPRDIYLCVCVDGEGTIMFMQWRQFWREFCHSRTTGTDHTPGH